MAVSDPLHYIFIGFVLVVLIVFILAWQQICSTTIVEPKKLCVRFSEALFATASLTQFILVLIYFVDSSDRVNDTLVVYIRIARLLSFLFGVSAMNKNAQNFLQSFQKTFTTKKPMPNWLWRLWRYFFYSFIAVTIICNIIAFATDSVFPLLIFSLFRDIFMLFIFTLVAIPLSILSCNHSQSRMQLLVCCNRSDCKRIVALIVVILAGLNTIFIIFQTISQYRHYLNGSMKDSPMPDLQSFLIIIVMHITAHIFNLLSQWHPIVACHKLHYSSLICVLVCYTDDTNAASNDCNEFDTTVETKTTSIETTALTSVEITITPAPAPSLSIVSNSNSNDENRSLLTPDYNSKSSKCRDSSNVLSQTSQTSLPIIAETDEKDETQ